MSKIAALRGIFCAALDNETLLWRCGDSLRYDAPPGVLTPDSKAALSRVKPSLLPLLPSCAATPKDLTPALRAEIRAALCNSLQWLTGDTEGEKTRAAYHAAQNGLMPAEDAARFLAVVEQGRAERARLIAEFGDCDALTCSIAGSAYGRLVAELDALTEAWDTAGFDERGLS